MLKEKAASGARWNAASGAVVAVAQLLQTMILAHLLPATDFGLMAMAMIVVNLGQIPSAIGLSRAVVQREEVFDEELSSLYWLSWLIGAATFLALIALAPLVAAFFGEPELVWLVRLGAAIFLVSPIGVIYKARFEREIRFGPVALAESVGTIVTLIAAVAAARTGYGASSFFIGLIAGAICRTLIVTAAGVGDWRPRARLKWTEVRRYLHFGAYQTADSVLTLVTRNLDYLIIGRLLGPGPLGIYRVLLDLIVKPVYRINPIVTRVAFPVLSRVQNDPDRLSRIFFSVVRVLTTLNGGLMLGFAAVAPIAIPLVLGEQWADQIALAQLLCLYAMLRSGLNPLGSLLLATGRVKLSFHWNIGVSAALAGVVYAGVVIDGIRGAAIAETLLMLLLHPVAYFVLVRPILGECRNSAWRVYAWPLVLGLPMFTVVVLVGRGLAGVDPVILLTLQIGIGAAIYVASNVVFRRDVVAEMLILIPRRG